LKKKKTPPGLPEVTDEGPLMHHLWSQGDYEISTDPARIDTVLVHRFLTDSYWAKGIPAETVKTSIENSICFGVYFGRQQVGFARVISDLATFAYLADVFVIPDYRGRGLSRWLMECIVSHPGLQGLRRWMLVTKDAHGLYAKFGFTPLKSPESWMEIHSPDVYRSAKE
jgi:GNAT superfamily N-acetyltransferase